MVWKSSEASAAWSCDACSEFSQQRATTPRSVSSEEVAFV